MSVATFQRVDGLMELVRVNLPRRVKSDGSFTDWNVVGPALVAIGADLCEAIVSSVPPRGRVRAEIMARSLAEYAIGFAWLAAPEDEEERANRLKRFEKDEFLERERSENKLRDHITAKPAYSHLVAEDRAGGPLPRGLLDDPTRERLAGLKGDTSVKAPPDALTMAFEADKRWMPGIELVQRNPFALIYFTLFVGPSFLTHPSVSAVGRVVVGTPPDLVVGMPEPLGVSESPYSISLLAFVNMLLVSSRALGWPQEGEIYAVLAR